MTHLGTQISALADGQLAPAAAERAMAHVAACADCAAELASARAARRALAAAFEVPVDPQLTARLIALGQCERKPRSTARLAEGSVPMPGSREAERVPAGCLRGEVSRSRLSGFSAHMVVAATAGLGVAAAGLLALGAQPEVTPRAHPAHALTLLSRAAPAQGPPAPTPSSGRPSGMTAQNAAILTAGQATAEASGDRAEGSEAETLGWLRQHGWSSPAELPDGYRVTALRVDVDGSEGVELDLTGPAGTIVVTEQQGRLDEAAVAQAPVVQVGERDVRLLSTAPWHAVWQSGGTVVSVVAQRPSPDAEELVQAYPHQGYDDGVLARLARGWVVVAGSWGP